MTDESQPGPSTPKKTSRPRGFCDDWLVKYDWLYLENGKMKCHPCVNTRQNTPFFLFAYKRKKCLKKTENCCALYFVSIFAKNNLAFTYSI